jgi:hypothetical protein
MNLFGWLRHRNRVMEALKHDDDRGWVAASYVGSGTALNPDRDEMFGPALLNAAYEAYATNPLAYAVAEHHTSFVLGGGVRIVAKDPRVQRVLDAFWNDDENNMDLRIDTIHTELCVFGEQFIRYFVDRLTGRVVVRQLDPLYVTAIETDPEDVEKPLRYLYKPPRRGEVDPSFGGVWIPARDVLHVCVNRVSSALRGRSDLATVIPWIRRYTEWLENRCRINKLKGNLLLDLTAHGAGAEELARLRARYATPPPSGTVLIHNEKETWKDLHSDIDAGDAADDGRAIRLMIATGAGLPEHYLAEGGNVNRATAAEMGPPTAKRFKRRQRLFKFVLVKILRRVLDEAQRVGRIGPRVDRSFTIEMEEIKDAGETPAEAMGRDCTQK